MFMTFIGTTNFNVRTRPLGKGEYWPDFVKFRQLTALYGYNFSTVLFLPERRELREITMRGLHSASLTDTLESRGQKDSSLSW